jgi:hypothetical protein
VVAATIEIGVAPHDKTKSPYGYHVIKRLK